VFHKLIVAIVLIFCSAAPAATEGHRFVGAWKALTYVIDSKEHPMEGLFVFTQRHYSANVRFKLGHESIDAANGNAGSYSIDGKRIVFAQWVQVHIRPGDPKESILSRKGPDEVSEYRFEGDRLILLFPSGNRYVLERITE